MLQYAHLSECLLQYFEVVDELVIVFDFPVDFCHGHATWVEGICELTVDCPSAELFYFGEVGFEQIVDPGEELAAGEFDGVVGVDGDFVDH